MTPVDQYIYNQPEQIRGILDFLHSEIQSFDAKINCTIKWNVPYYSKSKSLCYLNVLKGGTVELNFTKARAFRNEIKTCLDFRGRDLVGGLQFANLMDIDAELLQAVLKEAIDIDNA